MFEILNQGWVGSLIGLLGLIVGVIGLVLYLKSRIGPRPACQMHCSRLIGKEEQELPGDVQILFRKMEVPRLSLTRVWVWNCGAETLRGSQIVETDPLRCLFDEDSQILSASVASSTRAANRFSVTVSPHSPNEAVLTFDYLDPHDGARIELLHTSRKRHPEMAGTIRGIPKGIRDYTALAGANVFDRAAFALRRPQIFIVAGIIGVAAMTLGLLPDSWLNRFDLVLGRHRSGSELHAFRTALISAGALYALMPVLRVLSRRKKYPACLDIDLERRDVGASLGAAELGVAPDARPQTAARR